MLFLNNKSKFLFICAFLIFSTMGVYWQVTEFEFLDWDDTIYLTENPNVQAGITWDGIKWAFGSFHATNWHPLTWLSHMLDVQVFGMDAGWHHLSNVLFHAINALLLYLILSRITGLMWRSFFVAALFALHPLHVESVAWVAERKDVLSTFFFMLAIYCYTFYIQHPQLKRYLLVVICFALGLMAKPMLVTLPFVLLLLDYWPLKRFPITYLTDFNVSVLGQRSSVLWLVLEKMPLLMLSIVSSVITFEAQSKGGAVTGFGGSMAHGSVDSVAIGFGWIERLSNALVSYASYLGNTFYPRGLSFFYPYRTEIQSEELIQSAVLILVISLVAIWQIRRKPYLFIGWFWFVGMLVPVSGVVLVGWQSMADRYTYVPLIGVFMAIAWGVPELTKKWPKRDVILSLAMTASIFACVILSYIQIGYWRNNISLYEHAAEVIPESAFVHFKVGTVLAEKGEYVKAQAAFESALRVEPFDLRSRFNLGLVFLRLKQFENAIEQFNELLKRYPSYTAAEQQIEIARAMWKRQQMATAVNSSPEVYMRRGILLEQQGRVQDAILVYKQIVQYKPEYIQAHQKLGFLFYKLKRVDEAIAHYKTLAKLQPDSFVVHYNLGLALVDKGQLNEAIKSYQQALRIRPAAAEIYNNLGVAFFRNGMIKQAIDSFQNAIRIKPDYAQAKNNLNRALNVQSNGH